VPMTKADKIYVAGHNGMVGGAIVKELMNNGFANLITASSKELDLRRQSDVEQFFATHKPDIVVLAAAKVGGILANSTQKADFLMDNLSIELNVIKSAFENKAKKLLFLGSSCIYPKFAEQPLREDSLLTGSLEPTNEPYAIAKIAGIKMCETYREQYGANFISCMPTNLYGPGDNYDLKTSHVLPALLRKFHDAKMNNNSTVEIWGSGSPKREFLHVNDLAKACLFLLEEYNAKETINVGSGEEISIKELALLVAKVVGFKGSLTFDSSKPDGTPRKLMDVSRLHKLGWKHHIDLEMGIKSVYQEMSAQW
jgi:GDP-L-fucose synthase